MKIQNYSLPDVNGTKNFIFNNSIMTSLNGLTVIFYMEIILKLFIIILIIILMKV